MLLLPDEFHLSGVKNGRDRHGFDNHAGLGERLTAVLSGNRGRYLRVAISHRMLEFVTVPWSNLLLDPGMSMMYVRGLAEASLGVPAGETFVALDDAPAQTPRVASILPRQLLDSIQRACKDCGVVLDYAAPWLTLAYNQYRPLENGSCWWIGLEDGHAVLASVVDGRVTEVSSHAMSGAQAGQLDRIVRRAELVGGDATPRPRWLCDMRSNKAGDEPLHRVLDPALWRQVQPRPPIQPVDIDLFWPAQLLRLAEKGRFA